MILALWSKDYCTLRNPTTHPQGTHGTGKTGKMAKKIPCQGKHREFGNFVKTQGILSKHRENTGNFVSSNCKCSYSKCKGYCDSCLKKSIFFPEAG